MSIRGASPPVVGRHWAKLRYVALGEAPNRSEVGSQLLRSQWINAQDIYSFIALPNRKDFEIILFQEGALQSFTQIFDASVGHGFWKNWKLDTSAPQDVRFVYVKFWTGKVVDADVEQYLRRYCEILQPVFKHLGQFGLWYRVRRYKVKLRHDPDGNLYQIPNSISLGCITAGSHTLLRNKATLTLNAQGPNKARGPTPMPSTYVNTAQNGEHQSTPPQTSEVIQEAQISNEGPAQINNGEEAKSTSSISDSSDTSSGGSSDSSSEDSDSSEGILPPSGHQKESPGQEDTGAVMTSGRQLPENEGDAVLFTPDSSDSLQAGSLPPTQSSTAILSVAKKRRQRATSSSSSVQKEMKESELLRTLFMIKRNTYRKMLKDENRKSKQQKMRYYMCTRAEAEG
ncbi:hypothetical protein SRHO_G00142610 [Serrasalmus rhombeus]